ncbi:hypothetical protein LUZ62_066653 [Rhynchospora pubera]|uniref:CBM20 domain-containing protein n=1 Tax=Rhynchospora pubera TaxID=906938 RepID=A0AAV8EVT3_9POAL|nr:hypothetical protein LUZ62_066653 [Rhynchospora pubera]
MGTTVSRSTDSGHGGSYREGGAQLYVSLKMENFRIEGDLVPHVYGSVPIIGSWDPSKALSMERELASMWELSFVVPPDHEALDFKFLLKPKYGATPCVVEEGPNRLLTGGLLEGDAKAALFKLTEEEEVLECQVFIKADIVSPLDLAASWRAYQENLMPSRVRGIPDVSINAAPDGAVEDGSGTHLELDLEHYIIPAPSASSTSYLANRTETPTALFQIGNPWKSEVPFSNSENSNSSINGSSFTIDIASYIKESEVDQTRLVPPPTMVESKSVGTFSSLQNKEGQKGLFVDRGVGSPRLVKSASANTLTTNLNLDNEAKTMPEAAGAVAAAAVADRMHAPKEDRRLAIVLVGLPARGKTFTAAKLTRYLRWLGHETKHFNVGKYRRLKHGTNQSADFFRADNPEGMEARDEVAALAMEDMLAWMHDGGKVGIFDATNSTRKRRTMLMKMAEGKCKVIFLETICNDERIIERNIRLKIQQSPDYAEEPDYEAGLRDFKERLVNYEKVYEPVQEGSYIKMIDMVSGQGGQLQVRFCSDHCTTSNVLFCHLLNKWSNTRLPYSVEKNYLLIPVMLILQPLFHMFRNIMKFQVNNISGFLPGRIVFFLVNTHLTPRPILLTRHGESLHNVRGRIGGDTVLSEAGELYSKKLANFIEKRLKSEKTASIWTSTLQRTILTASPIVGFPKIQWRALDEINSGVCDGMTYEEIKKNMPEEYESRKKDKLRYRYPRGESYLDVIQRLEPVIIELERQRAPVVVISHQAVLRALYAYFADRPLREVPEIEVPLHTIIEIQMGVTGVEEKRYKLMDSTVPH